MIKLVKLLAAVTTVSLFAVTAVTPMGVNADELEATNLTIAGEAPSTAIEVINEHRYLISFVDDTTGKYVDNVQARLYKKSRSNTSAEHIVVAEWNSSDESVFVTEKFNDLDEYRYLVAVDKLPDGYIYLQDSSVDQSLPQGALGEEMEFQIRLERGEPLIPDDFPKTGEYSLNLRLLDKATGAPVKNVQCELFEIKTGEVITSWNTTENEVMHIEGLKYEFSTTRYNELGKIYYGIRIVSFPENYELPPIYPENKTERGLCGYYLLEFQDGYELDREVYLINTSEDDENDPPVVTGTKVPTVTSTGSTVNPSYPTTTTTTVISTVPFTGQGDANCDGRVTVADAVAILQHIGNRDKYGLSEQGKLNADVDGVEGITANDALVIQQWDGEGKL